MRRGGIWTPADGRDVPVVSLDGLESTYGAVLAIVLHPSGRYPDTAMSVAIDGPLACTAVAVNLRQLRVARFEDAECHGRIDSAVTERVDQALRAVLDP